MLSACSACFSASWVFPFVHPSSSSLVPRAALYSPHPSTRAPLAMPGYTSPLATLQTVIKTRSTSSMDFRFSVAVLLSSSLWTACAYACLRYITQSPNYPFISSFMPVCLHTQTASKSMISSSGRRALLGLLGVASSFSSLLALGLGRDHGGLPPLSKWWHDEQESGPQTYLYSWHVCTCSSARFSILGPFCLVSNSN